MESYIPPTRLRLKTRAQNVVASLYALPKQHPIRSVIRRVEIRTKAKPNGAKFPLVEVMKTMDVKELQNLAKVDTRPLEPWAKPTCEGVDIPEEDKATEKVISLMNYPEAVIYSDAASQNSMTGAAAVILDHQGRATKISQTNIGTAKHWPRRIAKLVAIYNAVRMIQGDVVRDQVQHYTVVSDSKLALQRIQNRAKLPDHVTSEILKLVDGLEERRIKTRFLWVSRYSGVPGMEIALKFAKEAVGLNKVHKFGYPLSAQKAEHKRKMLEEWKQEWRSSKNGRHLRKLDDGLPAKRTRRLYGNLTRHQVYLFTQLRSGHAWIASYGKLRKHREDDKCECGAIETVVHVIVHCPRLYELRQQLRIKVGDAYNNIANMLGGRLLDKQGKPITGPVNKEVVKAVIEFADASQRFRSRVSE